MNHLVQNRLGQFFAILVLTIFTSLIGSVSAQTGNIQGTIWDHKMEEPLPFATVTLTVNGSLVGAQTNFDGAFVLTDIPVGEYDITASYVGYVETIEPGIVVEADKTKFINIKMQEESKIYFCTFGYTNYKVPLIKLDDTTTGNTFTREEIRRSFR